MNNEIHEKKKRSLDPGNVLFAFYVGGVLCLVFLAMVADANGALEPGERTEIRPSEVRQGELLFTGAGNTEKYIPAPRLSQDVEMYVTALTARTIVHQQFVNNTDQWQEAIYVFPLADESAVDRMRMKVGTRIIEGEIKEKRKAQKVYEKAKREGKKASLLSQERPNIFTVALTNIAPGEEIGVEIEFQQVVNLSGGVFSLRFPLVVGPRYIPGVPLSRNNEQENIEFSGSGWSFNTDQVVDASRITPPVSLDREQQLNPVRLMVELAAGFPVARVESLNHGITVDGGKNDVHVIQFDGTVMADRDFVLEWEAEKQKSPQAALFTESQGDDDYLLLMLTPPAQDSLEEPPPRELIFVLDTSGSMAGSSIVQARQALILAISRLDAGDRFNVIEFNSSARRLFTHAARADETHRKEAIRFVSSLTADGGTEIASALNMALDNRHDHERIRQVIFLTDGSVGNESQLLTMIAARLGDSRLFTVGIGSAPNSYFMSRAATMGRGSFTYIGKSSEVREKMMELFRKLEYPAITDISVKTGDGRPLELYPDPIPDLYLGEPLLLSMKISGENDVLRISGRRGGRKWQQDISTGKISGRPGIASLWARRKIRSLMDSGALGVKEEEIREKVLATSLKHHLLSKYTSLVAVEKRISRPADSNLQQSALKINLPAGWQANKIFGGAARTATPALLQILMGLFLLVSALLLHRVNRKRTV